VFAVCLAALSALALSSSDGIAKSGPVSLSDLAPADEYFGRQHLSPIVIRHTIFSLKDDLHHARRRPDSISHDADLVQDALSDWAVRFPRDTWLPATFWNLAILYEELPGLDAQRNAIALLQQIRDRFARTPYAATAARDLQRGVGVRPWPHWAGAPPLATALTDADALIAAIHRGSDDPSSARAAWELAANLERLPGEQAQTQAIRLLALLVDRYPDQIFGKWALRDLKRGIGERH
jgi:hypothetical protein